MESQDAKTVVRKTYIKACFSGEQRAYFEQLYRDVLGRAAAILPVLIQKKHGGYDRRDSDGLLAHVNGVRVNKDFCDLYDLIVKGKNSSRAIRGPLVLQTCKTGLKSDKPLATQCRKMIEAKLLPLRMPPWDRETGYDFAAFEIAVSSLKSWHECNESTKANYAEKTKSLAAMTPDAKLANALEKWLKDRDYKQPITKRILKKFGKFGWGIRVRNYDFSDLQGLCDDVAAWKKVFEWKLADDHKARLRQTSSLKLPGDSDRDIHFGDNYRNFLLEFTDGKFTVTIDGHKVNAAHRCYSEGQPSSSYFKNLTVVRQGNKPTLYEFRYERGNNSPLDESVVGHLRELTLTKKGNEFFFGLSLNVVVPEYTPDAEDFLAYFFQDDATEALGYGPINIMGVDLGITNPASCAVVSASSNKRRTVSRFFLGEVKDREYYNNLQKFKKVITLAHQKIDDLDDALKGQRCFSPQWVWDCRHVANFVHQFKTEFNQICRWDLRQSRNGLTEMLLFIRVYKSFLSVLHRWTAFGTIPAAKGERRPKFQTHNRLMENVKKDFRKKVACEIVRAARERDVSVIAIEDLQHFLPDEAESARRNELLMLWGSGEIGRWIKHFADQYGIAVISLNPRMTSKTDPLTGYLGSRDHYDKEKLYVERNGKVEVEHADLAASENLASRAAARCSNEPFVKAVVVQGGYALWWKSDEDTKGVKMRKFRLTQRFGTHMVMVDDEGRVCPLKSTPLPTTYVHLNSYHDGWWPDEVRYERQKELAARAKAVNPTMVLTPVPQVLTA